MNDFVLEQQLPRNAAAALEHATASLEAWEKDARSAGGTRMRAGVGGIASGTSSSATAASLMMGGSHIHAGSLSGSTGMADPIRSASPMNPVSTTSTASLRPVSQQHPKASSLPASHFVPCTCPHLLQYLPHELDLTFCKTANNALPGWIFSCPVSALHLASQFDATSFQHHSASSASEELILYGEEQERKAAMQTAGLTESWHPWIRMTHTEPCHHHADDVPINSHTINTMTSFTSVESLPKQTTSAATSRKKRASGMPTKSTSPAKTLTTSPCANSAHSSPATTKKTIQTVPSKNAQDAEPVQKINSPPPEFVPSSPASSKLATAATALATSTSSLTARGSPNAIKQQGSSRNSSAKQANEAPPLTTAATMAPPSKKVTASASRSPKDNKNSPTKAKTTTSSTGMTLTSKVENPPQTMTLEGTCIPATLSPSMPPPPPQAPRSALSVPGSTAPLSSESTSESSTLSGPNVSTTIVTSSSSSASSALSQQQLHAQAATPPTFHLPESRYWSLHAQEDQIRVLRRHFLSKRAAPTPPSTSMSLSTSSIASSTPAVATAPPGPKRRTNSVASSTSNDSNAAVGSTTNKAGLVASGTLAALSSSAAIPPASSLSRKRKSEVKPVSLHQMVAWKSKAQPIEILTLEQEVQWKLLFDKCKRIPDQWMDTFRASREAYYRERAAWQQSQRHRQRQQQQSRHGADSFAWFLNADRSQIEHFRKCLLCNDDASLETCSFSSSAGNDTLMQCLECSFVGCAAQAVLNPTISSQEHILHHMLLANHNFAVTCGKEAKVYCFKCGDFVYHEIFDQERERMDIAQLFPWQGWKAHPVQHSFDAFQFFRVQDQGVVWKGMTATYPQLIVGEHLLAARSCRNRHLLFHGSIEDLPVLTAGPRAIEFAIRQSRCSPVDRWRIRTPVGMYNLGHTCFQSAILQCMINCEPLQRYFLRHVGHHHGSCSLYRSMDVLDKPTTPSRKMGSTNKKSSLLFRDVCIACEMDKLMLRYYGSSNGIDVDVALSDIPDNTSNVNNTGNNSKSTVLRGEPLITAEMLTAAWKCGGMDHLAGYDQRDAHEFLHAFLDIMGKHTRQYRDLIKQAINLAVPDNTLENETNVNDDFVKELFEGSLRSVLVCQHCGSKRIQNEHFMSISLPLSKEVQKQTAELPGESNESIGRVKLSVERCLRHFTMPEMLADPVDCPSCKQKTPTKKQHVMSKFPRVLCLHLKRFDSAQNRKIEDFVSFPARGLNMGPYLPHWCEVERVRYTDVAMETAAIPDITYDLFATVNHFGNLQSGHYVTNVHVDGKWYHCNDAHISEAGIGSGEVEVLKSDGAYLLFYIRQCLS